MLASLKSIDPLYMNSNIKQRKLSGPDFKFFSLIAGWKPVSVQEINRGTFAALGA